MRETLQAAYRRLPFKSQIFAALRKLPVPETVFKHLHFEGPFDVVVDQLHSFQMNHYGEQAQNEVFWRGLSSYEQTSIDLWRRLAATASVIVDGGAHTGLYSLIAGAVNPSATIFAFEPLPKVYDRLVENMRLNLFHAKAEKLALSDASGSTTFHVSSNVVGSSLEARAVEPGASAIPVQTVRLDDYLTRHRLPGVDLIKLDVERHEPAVLRGMGEVLERNRPTIITEILDNEVGDQIAEAVRNKEYRLFIVKEGEGVFPVSALSPPAGRIGQNFLLCQKKVARELGLR